jgi:hypothetical protein
MCWGLQEDILIALLLLCCRALRNKLQGHNHCPSLQRIQHHMRELLCGLAVTQRGPREGSWESGGDLLLLPTGGQFGKQCLLYFIKIILGS